MKNSTLSFIAAAAPVLVCLVAPPAASAETADLAPKFEAGRETKYALEVKTDTAVDFGGMKQDSSDQQEARVVVRVKSVEDDKVRVELVHEWMRVRMKNAMIEGTFDSDTPAEQDGESQLAAIVRPMVGKPLTLTLDKDGTIRDVSGLETMAPEGMAGELFNQMFRQESIINMYQPLFKVKPAPASAETGEKWSFTERENSALGMMAKTVEHTLLAVTNGDARINLQGKVELDIGDVPAGSKKDSSRVDGTMVWDTAKGQLKELKSESLVRAGIRHEAMSVIVDVKANSSLKRIE